MVCEQLSEGLHTLSPDDVQARFLAIMPGIEQAAMYAFRACRDGEREELVQEVIANSFVAFVRLLERGRHDAAFPTSRAAYAVRQARFGRRVGCSMNQRDLTSPVKLRHVASLHDRNEDGAELRSILIETRHAGPAETAAARLDVAAWYRTLPKRLRKIARTLALGETTSAVAQRFKLTAGRVSQLRRELREAWCRFAGEPVAA